MHFYVICLCDDLLHCADKLMDLLQRVPLCQLSRLTNVWVVESVTIESQALFCQSCFFLKKNRICARQTTANLPPSYRMCILNITTREGSKDRECGF